MQLYNSNLFDILPNIPDKSVDLILCDLPYGTTKCSWDTVLPFDQMWKEFERVIKPQSAIVLFSTEPFTSKLICSNLNRFKYRFIWKKTKFGAFPSAKLRPLKATEDICVFSDGFMANGSDYNMRYYPQGLTPINRIKKSGKYNTIVDSGNTYVRRNHNDYYHSSQTNYPKDILEFDHTNDFLEFESINKGSVHPTQKPVELLRYLIRTYTTENDIVLDPCMGSGSTGEAALMENREFIGIELQEKFFDLAKNRLENFDKEITQQKIDKKQV